MPTKIKKRRLPAVIQQAIKSGYVPKLRDWRSIKTKKERTLGENVCHFIERFLPIPEGPQVGKPTVLLDFQVVFICAIFDGPRRARRAILSVGRKAGKTALAAYLIGAFLFMDGICARNSRINSGALSRDQAALIFNYLSKSVMLSPSLSEWAHIIPSHKSIKALNTGISYAALAADASKAMGLSPPVVVLDEMGQVVGPVHPFAEALLTSQGAHALPLELLISTQAASDSDWLSIQIDDAIANPSDDVVCHLYEARPGCELSNVKEWQRACPALDAFRSRDDVATQAKRAARLPTAENSFRNLILNQRIAIQAAFMAPAPWRECGGDIDIEVFRRNTVAIGLDLSARNDLTAAVLAAKDESGSVHLLPFVFVPLDGLRERVLRDRAPYDVWLREGFIYGVAGRSMDYDQIACTLRDQLYDLGIEPAAVVFDRWGITHFKRAAQAVGFCNLAQWIECGQGFRDFSPRCKAFESLILRGQIRHGNHPALNMAFSSAVAERDGAGNVKLAKHKSSNRIDPAIAAIMASFEVNEGSSSGGFNPAALIG